MKLITSLLTIPQCLIHKRLLILWLLFSMGMIHTANAQFCLENRLVDINLTASSPPENFTAIGNKVFYSADGNFGTELYIYDAVTETNVTIDIYPGTNSIGRQNNSDPKNFTAIGDKVFFNARGPEGVELYYYDMTTNMNHLVDVNVGTRNSSPKNFIVVGDKLFFTAYTDIYGFELFFYDCNTSSLNPVDIKLGSSSSFPDLLTLVGNKIVFAARPINGTELFIYDIVNGNVAEVDINPGSNSSLPHSFLAKGDTIFYAATGLNGEELFIYDTTTGINTEIDINLGAGFARPDNFTIIGDKVFYSAVGSNGLELYIYDCTNNKNFLVDILPGPENSFPFNFTVMGDKLFYTASGPNGNELFIYDTRDNSNKEIDINVGPSSSSPVLLTPVGDKVFYRAAGTNGIELYFYDCNDGTNTLVDVNLGINGSFPGSLTGIGNYLFYDADVDAGAKLFIFDAINKTNTLIDIADSENFVAAGNKVVYGAYGASGYAPYIAEFIHPITITSAAVDVCLGSPLNINIGASGGTLSNLTYNWTGPNSFASTDQNPLISNIATIDMAGTYMVTVNNKAGIGSACSTTKSVEVKVNDCFTEMSFSMSDPCNCDNPANKSLDDGSFLFADKIRIDAAMYPTGTLPIVVALDGNLLTATGTPYTLATATAAVISLGGGIYELPFYTLPNAPSTLTIMMGGVGGDSQAFTTYSCMPCPDPIPTMNQWGVLIFGLLILNLSIFSIYRFRLI